MREESFSYVGIFKNTLGLFCYAISTVSIYAQDLHTQLNARRYPDYLGKVTMKLFSLQVLYKTDAKPKLLQGTYDLSSFSFFQRGSVQEFLDFTAKLVCERTALCSRAAVHENGEYYFCHVFVRQDKLCAVVFSDQEYPQRVAQTLLTKTLEDFSAEYSPSTWATMSAGGANMRKLGEYLVKYQDPRQADSLSKLQADVEDTTQILHQTLETLIERGEKLDDLVSKSEDLSSQSKLFYQTAKKTNSCCKFFDGFFLLPTMNFATSYRDELCLRHLTSLDSWLLALQPPLPPLFLYPFPGRRLSSPNSTQPSPLSRPD
ncbi:Synaptobrevin -like protein YKT6 [Echinococcus granulosus]|nr:Synaptobrevin -like protein YKT6 [Echinococcus granulosus]